MTTLSSIRVVRRPHHNPKSNECSFYRASYHDFGQHPPSYSGFGHNQPKRMRFEIHPAIIIEILSKALAPAYEWLICELQNLQYFRLHLQNDYWIFLAARNTLAVIIVRTKMPSQYMLNSAEEITSLYHVAFNPLLLDRSALDLLHLTRFFQRN